MEESRELFELETLPKILQRGAEALRKDEQLVDFTIIADGRRFAAHKVILAASSDFFRAMLQHSESIESRTNECHLKDVTSTVFEIILDFCYTSKIRLDIENVKDILLAASVLQIDALQTLCVEYIAKRIDTTNCSGFLILADRCNLPTLTETALSLCLENFEIVSEKEEFLQLDAGLLSNIISHDELLVDEEEEVLNAVMEWIAADNDRVCKLDSLVDHVRFPLMSARSLIILSEEEQIRQSKKCRNLIREAKHYHLLRAFPEDELRAQMVGKRFEPRSSRHRHKRIFAVGGLKYRRPTDNYSVTDTAEMYDPCLDKWVEIEKMPTARCKMSVSILGGYLYAVGGIGIGNHYLTSVSCYNIEESFWRDEVADMKFGRSFLGICALGGYIYAIGGQDGPNALDVVERYDPQTNRWEECARLGQKRYGAGVAVCNNFIYVVGGESTSTLKTVERFDPDKNKWSFVAPMATGRTFPGCTTFGGKIYVVGGGDGSGRCFDTGECYDPNEDRWDPIPSMNVKRSGLGLVDSNGFLYAAGGCDTYGKSIKLVQAYDPKEKKWHVKCPMIHDRWCAGFASYNSFKKPQFQT